MCSQVRADVWHMPTNGMYLWKLIWTHLWELIWLTNEDNECVWPFFLEFVHLSKRFRSYSPCSRITPQPLGRLIPLWVMKGPVSHISFVPLVTVLLRGSGDPLKMKAPWLNNSCYFHFIFVWTLIYKNKTKCKGKKQHLKRNYNNKKTNNTKKQKSNTEICHSGFGSSLEPQPWNLF